MTSVCCLESSYIQDLKLICLHISTEDKALAVNGDPYIDAAGGVAITAAKEEVGNFVQNSKIMMNVMDEVGKIHPFIQGDH